MKATLKIIGQIVLILAVAGLLIGALYAAVQFNVLGLASNGGRPERFEAEGQRSPRFEGQTDDGPGFRPEGDFEGREHGEHGPNLGRGLFGVAGSLVKLTVIVGLVLLVQTLFNRWQARKTPAAA